MSALELLLAVAAALLARGLAATIQPVLPGSRGIVIDGQLVARTAGEQVQVTAAQVFDGFKHVVPEGCDALLVSPERGAHLEVVKAVEARLAARARSLPVPTDPTAIVRDLSPQREPEFEIEPPVGSWAWQEGRASIVVPASELTDEHLAALGASDRVVADEWRRANDHEATVHNQEPPPAPIEESDQAFVDGYERDLDTAAE